MPNVLLDHQPLLHQRCRFLHDTFEVGFTRSIALGN